MDEMTKAVLAAWRDRFPNNAYAWPGAPESFAAEAVRVTLAAQPAAPVGDWLEDAAHENGNYQCRCVHCGRMFIGHKRRVTCKVCADWRDGWNAAISTTPGDH
jgi:hypothetical protein